MNKKAAMIEGPSRYEINRKVRQIFISHNADMTKISYSCAHKTIYIYGTLVKDPKGEFNISTIQTLVSELMRLPRISNVQFDLENWIISAEPGEMNIIKGGKFSQAAQKHLK